MTDPGGGSSSSDDIVYTTEEGYEYIDNNKSKKGNATSGDIVYTTEEGYKYVDNNKSKKGNATSGDIVYRTEENYEYIDNNKSKRDRLSSDDIIFISEKDRKKKKYYYPEKDQKHNTTKTGNTSSNKMGHRTKKDYKNNTTKTSSSSSNSIEYRPEEGWENTNKDRNLFIKEADRLWLLTLIIALLEYMDRANGEGGVCEKPIDGQQLQEAVTPWTETAEILANTITDPLRWSGSAADAFDAQIRLFHNCITTIKEIDQQFQNSLKPHSRWIFAYHCEYIPIRVLLGATWLYLAAALYLPQSTVLLIQLSVISIAWVWWSQAQLAIFISTRLRCNELTRTKHDYQCMATSASITPTHSLHTTHIHPTQKTQHRLTPFTANPHQQPLTTHHALNPTTTTPIPPSTKHHHHTHPNNHPIHNPIHQPRHHSGAHPTQHPPINTPTTKNISHKTDKPHPTPTSYTTNTPQPAPKTATHNRTKGLSTDSM